MIFKKQGQQFCNYHFGHLLSVIITFKTSEEVNKVKVEKVSQ